MALRDLRIACSLLLVASAACSEPSSKEAPSGSADPHKPPGEEHQDKGTDVDLTLAPDQTAVLNKLKQALAEVANITDSELLAKHAVATKDLTYDPADAAGLSLIQASPLALRPADLDVLKQRGLVISRATAFPTFTYGYTNIYMADLPVFISADSILSAIHTSYDDILQAFERDLLVPELTALLQGMRANLASSSLSAQDKHDLDVFLGVAEALLKTEPGTGATAEASSAIQAFVALANSATGTKESKLFGVARDIDFSQFTVRGHYKDDPVLEAYFRSMMWLGRTDFRLIETLGDGSQVFRRRQFDAMLAIRSLLDAPLLARYKTIERVIRSFVGESDNMVLEEVDPLLAALKSAGGKTSELSDEKIAQALIAGGYGTQEIASQLIINVSGEELPLSRTFMLFGQRYVIDSHVFSNVTWARTKAQRMMPDPLDVAFAALGNDSAAALLGKQLETYAYAPNLESTRILVDAHEAPFWEKNLYNHWLYALRTLSPTQKAEDHEGLPEIAHTDGWGRRVLNTQLASWAELRHDTILYAKQSYTDGAECEFPDAYVEPYPAFFAAIETFAAYGKELSVLAEGKSWLANHIATYFDKVANVASILRSMAAQQRIGEPFNEAQLAFINHAVAPRSGCAGPDGSEGWYADLFFTNAKSIAYDPTIADVHTQPTDEGGAPVGHVLHVATGNPRLMVVTVDTCMGPRAYAGLASAYHETITKDFERLDDDAWAPMAPSATDVPWLSPVVSP